FLVLVIFVRIFSLPVSVAPAGAALLFFGAYGSRRQWWVPVVMLAGADVYLTLGHYHYPLGWDQLLTWAWYAGAVLLGGVLRDKVRPGRVFGATVAAAVTFFLLSNFAVWA